MCALASIIINNYNYSCFLNSAIDSALAQSYPNVEVIVVDDGSTDGSREIIKRYAACHPNRLRAVFKPNGGQASALNAGFAQSRGEVVLFLDADDLLLPETVARVVEKFAGQNRVAQSRVEFPLAKVQFPLETIDEGGRVLGSYRPSSEKLPAGDLRREALSFPDDLHWQPTSGNAFARWVLAQILPMPEVPYRLCADYYLSNIPPLLGAVDRLEAVGARYRIHAKNNHNRSSIDMEQTRAIIERTICLHRDMHRFAHKRGLRFPSDPLDVPSVTFVAQRFVSLALAPEHHPLTEDTRAGLLRRGIRAALGRFDVDWSQRLQYIAWFCLFYLSALHPKLRWVAECLGELFFFPNRRAQILRQLLTLNGRAHRLRNKGLMIKHLLFR